MRLVRVRAQAMARAAAATATGMTAVLGGDEAEVLAAIEAHGLTPANVNGAGQIVAAGTMDQLAAFAADPPPRPGCARCRWRAPSTPGTWPRPSTRCARPPQRAPPATRRWPCCPTATAAVVRSGADWLERIVAQVSAPVRWDSCMQSMAGLRRHRADRAAAGRHPDRAGPPRPARRAARSALKTPGRPGPAPAPCSRPSTTGADERRRAAPARPAGVAARAAASSRRRHLLMKTTVFSPDQHSERQN